MAYRLNIREVELLKQSFHLKSIENVPGVPECWVDGYDAGFAGVYDKDRANECNDIPGDQYNRSWPFGCKDRGLTEGECSDIKNDPDDIDIIINKIDELVMMTDMRMAGIAILSIKIEIVDVRNTVIHTKVDSVEAVNQ